MSAKYYHGTGRRKSAIARVRLYPGTGSIVINDKPADEYFSRDVDRMQVREPLNVTSLMEQFNVMVKVEGGGVSGQAGAVRHGIARALLSANPELRKTLRDHGFLTRDPRAVERKKYGKPKARRSFQFSKR